MDSGVDNKGQRKTKEAGVSGMPQAGMICGKGAMSIPFLQRGGDHQHSTGTAPIFPVKTQKYLFLTQGKHL